MARTCKLFAVLVAVLSSSHAAEWRSQFLQGQQHLEAGRFAQAWTELTAARKSAETAGARQDELPELLNALGRAAFKLGKVRESKACFTRAAEILESVGKPHATVYFNLGKAHQELFELRKAEAAFRKALKIQPNEPTVRQGLGQVFMVTRRLREAEAEFRASLATLSPDATETSSVLADMAMLYQLQDNHVLAVETYAKALEIKPPGQVRARILANRANALLNLRRYQDAEKDVRQALDEIQAVVGPSHPDVASVLDQYAVLLKKTGRRNEADAISRRVRAIEMSFAGQTNSTGSTVDWQDLTR